MHNKKLLEVLNYSDEAVLKLAESLFPTNEYQQTILIAYVRTLQCQILGIKRSPSTYVPNLIGEAGKGKTAIVLEFGEKMTEFFQEPFEIRTQPLSGLNDFADVIGVLHVEDGISKLAPSANFPKSDSTSLGLLFLDDFNRAHQHILSAAMQFVNTFQFSTYRLPKGWGVVAASNPEDGEYSVTGLDEAQYTRFVPVEYKPDLSVLLQQMELQQSPEILKSFLAKVPDVFPVREFSLPNPRPLNWRSFMIFSQMFSICQYSPKLGKMLANSMLGPGAYAHLEEIVSEEHPITLSSVLSGEFEESLEFNQKNGRFDQLARANQEIINHAKLGQTSRKDMEAVFEYSLQLPDSFCTDLWRRLLETSHATEWALAGNLWGSTEAGVLGPLGQKLAHAQRNLATEILQENLQKEMDAEDLGSGQSGPT